MTDRDAPTPRFWPTQDHVRLLEVVRSEMEAHPTTLLWAMSAQNAEETFRGVASNRFASHAAVVIQDARARAELQLRTLVPAPTRELVARVLSWRTPSRMHSRHVMLTTLVTLAWEEPDILDRMAIELGVRLAPAEPLVATPMRHETGTLWLFASIDDHPRAA